MPDNPSSRAAAGRAGGFNAVQKLLTATFGHLRAPSGRLRLVAACVESGRRQRHFGEFDLAGMSCSDRVNHGWALASHRDSPNRVGGKAAN
jgi:hypothetical protein